MQRSAIIDSHSCPNEDLVDAQEEKKEYFDIEECGKSGLLIDFVIVLVVGLHDEVEDKEGVEDMGAIEVQSMQIAFFENDEIDVNKADGAHDDIPEGVGLHMINRLIKLFLIRVDDVEPRFFVPQGISNMLSCHVDSL